MKLYIITKNGQPFIGSIYKKDTYAKAYHDQKIAWAVAKAFCTKEARSQVSEWELEMSYTKKKEAIKGLADQLMTEWNVVEVEI